MKKDIKKLIIMVLIMISIMLAATFVLAHDYHWIKPEKPQAKWKVEFTSIAEGEVVGAAVSRKKPQYSSTNASFFVDLTAPGDSMTYDVQVSNLGNIDSVLDDIVFITSPNKEAIKVELIDIHEGDRLKAMESRNFKIRIYYELHATEAIEFDKPVSIVLNYKQAY